MGEDQNSTYGPSVERYFCLDDNNIKKPTKKL